MPNAASSTLRLGDDTATVTRTTNLDPSARDAMFQNGAEVAS
jgi:hypothetical protein